MPTPEETLDLGTKLGIILPLVIEVLYHPARPCNYTGATDLHQKTRVEVGHRKGDIDVRLAPIIKKLWEAGAETLGSCQEYVDGQAYIQFLAGSLGVEQFCAALTQLGIDHTTSPDDEPASISLIPNGIKVAELRFESVKVKFAPDSIDMIVQALG